MNNGSKAGKKNGGKHVISTGYTQNRRLQGKKREEDHEEKPGKA
ncbi:hypothetical protein [Oceanobacillus massiliensis]